MVETPLTPSETHRQYVQYVKQSLLPILPAIFSSNEFPHYVISSPNIIIADDKRFSILRRYGGGNFHQDRNGGKSLIKEPLDEFILKASLDERCIGIVPIPEDSKLMEAFTQMKMEKRASGIVLPEISRGFDLYLEHRIPSDEIFRLNLEDWEQRTQRK